MSFDDFVTFLFDKDVVPLPEKAGDPEPWYWNADITYGPRTIAAHYIRLFAAPTQPLKPYSARELEQGFWAIQSCNLECCVGEIIWDKRIPFDMRESCIRSMEILFAQFFSSTSLETSVEMWWDSLAYGWHCGNYSRANGGEEELLQDIMFETLTKILGHPSLICQAAALHGLGHLHHPHTEAAIQSFIGRNRALSDEMRAYALAAARFDVM